MEMEEANNVKVQKNLRLNEKALNMPAAGLETDPLKKFTIPKIRRTSDKVSLTPCCTNQREYSSITRTLNQSCLDIGCDLQSLWAFGEIQLVHNEDLEKKFAAKRTKMREEGRQGRELEEHFCFLVLRRDEVSKIYHGGICAGESAMKELGNPLCGVYLFRHVDIALSYAKSKLIKVENIMIFKVLFGRVKKIQPPASKKKVALDPTPNFDCHVSRIAPSLKDPVDLQATGSLIYFYEYSALSKPVDKPRQCLPYAVVAVKFIGQKMDSDTLTTPLRALSKEFPKYSGQRSYWKNCTVAKRIGKGTHSKIIYEHFRKSADLPGFRTEESTFCSAGNSEKMTANFKASSSHGNVQNKDGFLGETDTLVELKSTGRWDLLQVQENELSLLPVAGVDTSGRARSENMMNLKGTVPDNSCITVCSAHTNSSSSTVITSRLIKDPRLVKRGENLGKQNNDTVFHGTITSENGMEYPNSEMKIPVTLNNHCPFSEEALPFNKPKQEQVRQRHVEQASWKEATSVKEFKSILNGDNECSEEDKQANDITKNHEGMGELFILPDIPMHHALNVFAEEKHNAAKEKCICDSIDLKAHKSQAEEQLRKYPSFPPEDKQAETTNMLDSLSVEDKADSYYIEQSSDLYKNNIKRLPVYESKKSLLFTDKSIYNTPLCDSQFTSVPEKKPVSSLLPSKFTGNSHADSISHSAVDLSCCLHFGSQKGADKVQVLSSKGCISSLISEDYKNNNSNNICAGYLKRKEKERVNLEPPYAWSQSKVSEMKNNTCTDEKSDISNHMDNVVFPFRKQNKRQSLTQANYSKQDKCAPVDESQKSQELQPVTLIAHEDSQRHPPEKCLYDDKSINRCIQYPKSVESHDAKIDCIGKMCIQLQENNCCASEIGNSLTDSYLIADENNTLTLAGRECKVKSDVLDAQDHSFENCAHREVYPSKHTLKKEYTQGEKDKCDCEKLLSKTVLRDQVFGEENCHQAKLQKSFISEKGSDNVKAQKAVHSATERTGKKCTSERKDDSAKEVKDNFVIRERINGMPYLACVNERTDKALKSFNNECLCFLICPNEPVSGEYFCKDSKESPASSIVAVLEQDQTWLCNQKIETKRNVHNFNQISTCHLKKELHCEKKGRQCTAKPHLSSLLLTIVKEAVSEKGQVCAKDEYYNHNPVSTGIWMEVSNIHHNTGLETSAADLYLIFEEGCVLTEMYLVQMDNFSMKVKGMTSGNKRNSEDYSTTAVFFRLADPPQDCSWNNQNVSVLVPAISVFSGNVEDKDNESCQPEEICTFDSVYFRTFDRNTSYCEDNMQKIFKLVMGKKSEDFFFQDLEFEGEIEILSEGHEASHSVQQNKHNEECVSVEVDTLYQYLKNRMDWENLFENTSQKTSEVLEGVSMKESEGCSSERKSCKKKDKTGSFSKTMWPDLKITVTNTFTTKLRPPHSSVGMEREMWRHLVEPIGAGNNMEWAEEQRIERDMQELDLIQMEICLSQCVQQADSRMSEKQNSTIPTKSLTVSDKMNKDNSYPCAEPKDNRNESKSKKSLQSKTTMKKHLRGTSHTNQARPEKVLTHSPISRNSKCCGKKKQHNSHCSADRYLSLFEGRIKTFAESEKHIKNVLNTLCSEASLCKSKRLSKKIDRAMFHLKKAQRRVHKSLKIVAKVGKKRQRGPLPKSYEIICNNLWESCDLEGNSFMTSGKYYSSAHFSQKTKCYKKGSKHTVEFMEPKDKMSKMVLEEDRAHRFITSSEPVVLKDSMNQIHHCKSDLTVAPSLIANQFSATVSKERIAREGDSVVDMKRIIEFQALSENTIGLEKTKLKDTTLTNKKQKFYVNVLSKIHVQETAGKCGCVVAAKGTREGLSPETSTLTNKNNIKTLSSPFKRGATDKREKGAACKANVKVNTVAHTSPLKTSAEYSLDADKCDLSMLSGTRKNMEGSLSSEKEFRELPPVPEENIKQSIGNFSSEPVRQKLARVGKHKMCESPVQKKKDKEKSNNCDNESKHEHENYEFLNVLISHPDICCIGEILDEAQCADLKKLKQLMLRCTKHLETLKRYFQILQEEDVNSILITEENVLDTMKNENINVVMLKPEAVETYIEVVMMYETVHFLKNSIARKVDEPRFRGLLWFDLSLLPELVRCQEKMASFSFLKNNSTDSICKAVELAVSELKKELNVICDYSESRNCSYALHLLTREVAELSEIRKLLENSKPSISTYVDCVPYTISANYGITVTELDYNYNQFSLLLEHLMLTARKDLGKMAHIMKIMKTIEHMKFLCAKKGKSVLSVLIHQMLNNWRKSCQLKRKGDTKIHPAETEKWISESQASKCLIKDGAQTQKKRPACEASYGGTLESLESSSPSSCKKKKVGVSVAAKNSDENKICSHMRENGRANCQNGKGISLDNVNKNKMRLKNVVQNQLPNSPLYLKDLKAAYCSSRIQSTPYASKSSFAHSKGLASQQNSRDRKSMIRSNSNLNKSVRIHQQCEDGCLPLEKDLLHQKSLENSPCSIQKSSFTPIPKPLANSFAVSDEQNEQNAQQSDTRGNPFKSNIVPIFDATSDLSTKPKRKEKEHDNSDGLSEVSVHISGAPKVTANKITTFQSACSALEQPSNNKTRSPVEHSDVFQNELPLTSPVHSSSVHTYGTSYPYYSWYYSSYQNNSNGGSSITQTCQGITSYGVQQFTHFGTSAVASTVYNVQSSMFYSQGEPQKPNMAQTYPVHGHFSSQVPALYSSQMPSLAHYTVNQPWSQVPLVYPSSTGPSSEAVWTSTPWQQTPFHPGY
ncbi:testis-expressed protein 15 isoform X1 [Alligator sinensis]|uniref:Testis-expressed protein 15 isoform X1 n=1 Tax=Alligator sinensis TaxID=38654 RepID=A0A3Q0HMP0_ALLSI|nr:testis-expressed protein 15 isoform X1 [Alligator sinensis]